MNAALTELRKTLQHSGTVRLFHFTPFRNLMAGAGIAYALEKEKPAQIPLAIFVPSIYAGYHAYKNREAVKDFVSEMT